MYGCSIWSVSTERETSFAPHSSREYLDLNLRKSAFNISVRVSLIWDILEDSQGISLFIGSLAQAVVVIAYLCDHFCRQKPVEKLCIGWVISLAFEGHSVAINVKD